MASQSLQLFLKLLPFGSYHQIIGFGSSFEKYDIEPKRNLKKNSKYSIISIGFGEKCNGVIIKSIGIFGKGNYIFYTKLDKLNTIIVLEIKKANRSFITNFNSK